MKTKSKALLMTLCAVLLVAASVLGTMAYLTSTTKEVTNTFSIGKINITLDEAPVDEYGKQVDGNRHMANSYKLVPNHTYTKDPAVHVKGDSEDSYIFVKVVNGIEAIEATGDTTIASQMTAKGWQVLPGVANVYYQKYTKQNTDKDLVVFENFTVKNDVSETTLENYASATITITAYAIQQDSFTTAKAAWDAAGFGT